MRGGKRNDDGSWTRFVRRTELEYGSNNVDDSCGMHLEDDENADRTRDTEKARLMT